MKSRIITILLTIVLYIMLNVFYSFINLNIMLVVGFKIIFIVSVIYAVYESITD